LPRQGIWKIGQGKARQGSKMPQGSLEARPRTTSLVFIDQVSAVDFAYPVLMG